MVLTEPSPGKRPSHLEAVIHKDLASSLLAEQLPTCS